jgi:probable rRNA maturation factor
MKYKNFYFFRQSGICRFPRKKIMETADAMIMGDKLDQRQMINSIFCPNSTIRALNKKYLGKDRFTDVIAFTFDEQDFLGEAYISTDQAAIQAKRFGLSFDEELVRLLVHSVIHLLGYDHRTIRQRSKMEKRESRYCILRRPSSPSGRR